MCRQSPLPLVGEWAFSLWRSPTHWRKEVELDRKGKHDVRGQKQSRAVQSTEPLPAWHHRRHLAARDAPFRRGRRARAEIPWHLSARRPRPAEAGETPRLYGTVQDPRRASDRRAVSGPRCLGNALWQWHPTHHLAPGLAVPWGAQGGLAGHAA